MSRQLSSLFVGSAVVVAVLSGCADPNVEPPTPETAERRAALGFGFANTLAFPEYDLNALIPGALVHDRDANNIQEHIDAGWRLHDLSVWSTSPLRFSGAFVLNSGVYHQAGHGWDYDSSRRSCRRSTPTPSGASWTSPSTTSAASGAGPRSGRQHLRLAARLQAARQPARVDLRRRGDRPSGRLAERGPDTTCSTQPCIPLQTFSSVMIENVPLTNDWRTQHIGRSDMAGLTALMGSPATACSDPGQNPAFSGSGNCRRRLAVIVQVTGDHFFYVTEEVPEDNGLYDVSMPGEGEQTWWASGLFWDEGNFHDPDSIWHVRARLGARPLRLRPYTAPEGLRYIATFAPSTEVFPDGVSDGNLVLQEVDELVARHMRRMGVPGLTLGIVQGNRLVHARGYGYSDLQNFHNTKPTDLFRIASISKVLAKAAIVRLMTTGGSVTLPGGGVPVPLGLDTKPWGTVWSYDTNGITWHPNLGDARSGSADAQLRPQVRLGGVLQLRVDGEPARRLRHHRDVGPCNPFDEVAATPENWAAIERSLGANAFYHHRSAGDQELTPCPASMDTLPPDPACSGFPGLQERALPHHRRGDRTRNRHELRQLPAGGIARSAAARPAARREVRGDRGLRRSSVPEPPLSGDQLSDPAALSRGLVVGRPRRLGPLSGQSLPGLLVFRIPHRPSALCHLHRRHRAGGRAPERRGQGDDGRAGRH